MLLQKRRNIRIFKSMMFCAFVMSGSLSWSSHTFAKEETCFESDEIAVSTLTVEIQNYSDWNVRFRAIRNDGSKGPVTKIYKPGSHRVTLDNASKLIVQWQDGMTWRKYNAFTVRSSSMCVKATGKVMQLNGIKVITGC
ncbi:MAG: hypothetical protein JXR07_16445 [Reichenbachiella sp.]